MGGGAVYGGGLWLSMLGLWGMIFGNLLDLVRQGRGGPSWATTGSFVGGFVENWWDTLVNGWSDDPGGSDWFDMVSWGNKILPLDRRPAC